MQRLETLEAVSNSVRNGVWHHEYGQVLLPSGGQLPGQGAFRITRNPGRHLHVEQTNFRPRLLKVM